MIQCKPFATVRGRLILKARAVELAQLLEDLRADRLAEAIHRVHSIRADLAREFDKIGGKNE